MNDRPVVCFQNVSKRFRFTSNKPQTVLESIVATFSRRASGRERDLWAVRDVSFDVDAGQSLGIIGRNGSGKSTILKLITRILRPTAGRVVVRGRVSALLELGAGFHPDLTGRENIFLNAAVLGLSKQETERCYDSILAFSELEEFINMPVKHYSSGMYMRLGFSIAIHVAPDILIVDEILAVGDQAFQTKCVDHIYEMKRQGTTIIMVSHDLAKIQKLCTDLLWIENGEIRSAGPTQDVVDQYQDYMSGRESKQLIAANGAFERWGNGEIELTAVRFLNAAGEEQRTFKTGDKMTIEMSYMAHKVVKEPEFGLAIFHQDGTHVNGPNTRLANLQMGVVEGEGVVRYQIEHLPLLPARYLVTTAVHNSKLPIAYDYHQQAYSFRVVSGGTPENHGLIEIPATWQWLPAGCENEEEETAASPEETY